MDRTYLKFQLGKQVAPAAAQRTEIAGGSGTGSGGGRTDGNNKEDEQADGNKHTATAAAASVVESQFDVPIAIGSKSNASGVGDR